MNREIRTDLAIELRENVADRRNMPGVKVKTVVNEDRSIKTTTITVLDEIGEKNLGKAKGQYITIECSINLTLKTSKRIRKTLLIYFSVHKLFTSLMNVDPSLS